LRIEKGLSQEKLAEKIGMSRNMISLIECADSNTPVLTLYKIYKTLGKDLSKLFE
jgi:transcriptional regulator with XRE-family HTH domain